MEVQEENILELLSGGQELFYASDAAKADASDVAASTSQPKTPHDRRPTSDDDGDYDMDRLIEQDLAHANAALGRQLHRATAGQLTPMLQRQFDKDLPSAEANVI